LRLIKLLARYSKSTLILAIAGGVIGGGASTGLLFVINAGLSSAGKNQSRLLYTFLALAAFAMVTRAGSALMLAHLGQGALARLRIRLSRQILSAPLRKLEDLGAARLLGILTDDILNIVNALANVPLICVNVAGLLTCLIFLAWLSWTLFLAVIALIVLAIVAFQLPFLAASKHFTAARKEHNNVLGNIRSLISGVKELKLNRDRRNAFITEMLEGSSDRFRIHSLAAMKIYILGATFGEMLSFITIGLLVFLAPHIMHVETATLTSFVLVLLYVMEPIEYILNQAPQVGKASVALKNIESVGLTLADGGSEEHTAADLPPVSCWNSLELRALEFSYPREDEDGHFVLGPVSLSFSPGEVVFLTGGNGSGKTTLAKLLVGLYSPERGEIALDGKAVAASDLDNFRQNFSTVFSDFYLFEALLGLNKGDLDDRATAHLQQLQLAHKVRVKDGVLSTIDLSLGQRKRLALLTAYLDDRPVFLFDEWAADQDAAFKDIFYYEILPELKARNKSVFVITHDERYYDAADRIIKMDNGQVVSDTTGMAVEKAAAGGMEKSWTICQTT
jgi:putative ATP-binding cassette transporter